MKQFGSFLIMLMLLVSISACCKPVVSDQSESQGPTWQEQYDLGVRYLSEGDYEEAIIAFTAAIEIDPKQAPAYVALADAYICQGNYDKAMEILNGALDKVSNTTSVQDKIDELEGGNSSDSNGSNANLLEKGATNNMIRFEEVNFLGHSIENLNIGTMKELMAQNGFVFNERNDGDHWWIGSNPIYTEYGAEITALQYKDEDYVCLWGYTHYTHAVDRLPLPIGVRDIKTCDTLETVLTQLGFSNGPEISEYIQKMVSTPSSMEEIRRSFEQLTYTTWDPETDTSTRFMFTGNGSYTPLDNGTYISAQAELEVSFFLTGEKSYSLRFVFEDTDWGKFSNCLYNYDVNIW